MRTPVEPLGDHQQLPMSPAPSLGDGDGAPDSRPAVSIVVPAYNESAILERSLTRLLAHLQTLEHSYRWELVVVDDGSDDGTGDIADAFAAAHPNVRVLHHPVNLRLGQALRSAFSTCQGDYVVTMDCDLTYSPQHIDLLLDALHSSRAKVAIASPYMRGGRATAVPLGRRVLSRGANRFLSVAAAGHLSTLTSMVRAYDRRFLRTLSLKAMGTDINTEILFKAQLLGARVVEVPAHLDWSESQPGPSGRRSSLRIARSTSAYVFSGFMFRPVAFFVLPGLVLLVLASYTLGWVAWNTLGNFREASGGLDPRFTAAISQTFDQSPYAFVVGGVSLLFAVQLVSLGILASQGKRYFEELFYLSTTLLRAVAPDEELTPPVPTSQRAP